METSAPEPSADVPRVLVVAHNPFSDVQNNGKTLSGFFEGWPKDRLAQLYLTLDEPSFTVCDRFYRVTDLDVLKRLARRPGRAGRVRPTSWSSDGETKTGLLRNPLYRAVRSLFLARPPSALLVRSWVWRTAGWRSPDLEAWVDEVDPELVFFQSSNATFAFDIVETLCRTRGIPLVMETTDDYVTGHRFQSPFGWWYQRRIQAAYRSAVREATAVIAIGDDMAREYAARFGGRYVVAMNSVELGAPPAPREGDGSTGLVLHYAGNLGLNRWQVLAAVGDALAGLSAGTGVRAELQVFSIDAPEPSVREALERSGHVRFRGRLDSEELAAERAAADMVVHVESFDPRNRRVTRLSVSTKIPEYLASGRPVLAVGPTDVASIRYLRDNDVASVATSLDTAEIAGRVREVVDEPGRTAGRVQRGLDLVERNHSREQTQALVRDVVLRAATRP